MSALLEGKEFWQESLKWGFGISLVPDPTLSRGLHGWARDKVGMLIPIPLSLYVKGAYTILNVYTFSTGFDRGEFRHLMLPYHHSSFLDHNM